MVTSDFEDYYACDGDPNNLCKVSQQHQSGDELVLNWPYAINFSRSPIIVALSHLRSCFWAVNKTMLLSCIVSE